MGVDRTRVKTSSQGTGWDEDGQGRSQLIALITLPFICTISTVNLIQLSTGETRLS